MKLKMNNQDIQKKIIKNEIVMILGNAIGFANAEKLVENERLVDYVWQDVTEHTAYEYITDNVRNALGRFFVGVFC